MSPVELVMFVVVLVALGLGALVAIPLTVAGLVRRDIPAWRARRAANRGSVRGCGGKGPWSP
jgi:hypothetical protein